MEVSVGTRFPQQRRSPLENRKQLDFRRATGSGENTVDAPVTESQAILERGSSLLPRIKTITGNFSRGEVIIRSALEGRGIAHGVSRYNSDALRRIAGRLP